MLELKEEENARNRRNGNGGGKLLLISDLEGCMEESLAKVRQARFMCDQPFFKEIQKHLNNNKNNRVAFLGDYFDQGNKVESSIIEIINLYENNPGRVHILLGNRDINKLRLAEEMKETAPEVGDLRWDMWKSFYGELPTTTSLASRLKCIVSKSMGAKYPVQITDRYNDEFLAEYLLVKMISDQNGSNYFFEKNSGVAANKREATEKTFMKNYIPFINAVRKLFQYGKIVIYDEKYKTLMSHAGGMDTFLFHTPAYYKKITDEIATLPTHFDKIEKARELLMQVPEDKTDRLDVNTYNAPLEKVVNEVFSGQAASPDFYLLQALGLKPDEGRHFVSFVQSCDNTSCKGPNAEDSGIIYEGYPEFQGILVNNGIKILASGHAPHCAPVPLIYKRSDFPTTENMTKGLLYVLNDTSNGYRPESRVKDIESYPLAYITDNGVSAGVGMLPTLTSNGMEKDDFGFMFGEWSLSNAPIFKYQDGKGFVQYEKGQLTFPGRPFKQPQSFAPAVPVKQGGGRRRKQKTRKGRKASRKGRKTRKY